MPEGFYDIPIIGNPIAEDPGGDTGVPPPPPGFTDYFSTAHKQFPYLLVKVQVSYFWRTGWVQQPIAADDANGKVASEFKVAAAWGRKTVRFHIVRAGAEPIVPDPLVVDENAVLLAAWVVPGNLKAMSDGVNFIWNVRGKYVFGLTEPIFSSDGFKVPLGPYTYISQAELGPQFFADYSI